MIQIPFPKRTVPVLFGGILLGMLITKTIPFIYAQVQNNVIHGCVGPLTGILRVIDPNGTCRPNETPLEWNQQGVMGPTGATGTGGNGSSTLGSFTTNQLVNYWGEDGSSWDYKNFDGVNLTGARFNYKSMRYASFIGANFSNLGIKLEANLENSNFSSSNFTNSEVSFDNTNNTNLTGANFTHVTIDPATTLNNANCTSVNFTGATITGIDLTNTTLTGVIWSDTTCPDGTNSNNNGNTCEGHLVP